MELYTLLGNIYNVSSKILISLINASKIEQRMETEKTNCLIFKYYFLVKTIFYAMVLYNSNSGQISKGLFYFIFYIK